MLSAVPSFGGNGPLSRAFAARQAGSASFSGAGADDNSPFASTIRLLSELPDDAQASRRGTSSSWTQGGGKSAQQPIKLQLTSPASTARPSASAAPSSQVLVRGVRQLLDFGAETSAVQPDLNTLYRQCDLIANYSLRTQQDRPLQDLYDAVSLEMDRSLGAVTRQLRGSLPSQGEGNAWLQSFASAWTTWKSRTSLVANILLPLDRSPGGSAEARRPIRTIAVDKFAQQAMEDEALKGSLLPFTTQALVASCRSPLIDSPDIKSYQPSNGKQTLPPLPDDAVAFQALYSQSILPLFRETGQYEALKEALHQTTAEYYERVAKVKLAESKAAAPSEAAAPPAGKKAGDDADQTGPEAEKARKAARDAVPASYAELYITWLASAIAHEHSLNSWLYSDEFAGGKAIAIVHEKAAKDLATELLPGESRGRLARRAPARFAATTHTPLTGIPALLDGPRIEALAHVYSTFTEASIERKLKGKSDPPGATPLAMLRTTFGEHIKKRVEAIVLDKSRDEEMVTRLLDFKVGLDEAIAISFKGDDLFAGTLRDAYAWGVNRRENKPPELIAKHLDVLLKSGNKTMTDAQMETALNNALILFRFTRDKDMFEEFYTRHFAKRLLLNKSASSDAEMSMLLKLKEECGPDFTRKLETMLKDISLSDDIMKSWESFEAKSRSNNELKYEFDLSVNVLTQAHWPSYPQHEIIIPKDMEQATETFKVFYQGRNSGRKLHWQHSLGSNTVIAEMPKAGQKELHVSTYQTVVLLLFNGVAQGKTLSYKEIQTLTGLEPAELKRTLQSLACGQIPTRVLRKTPQGKDVNDDDVFSINEHLKNDRMRIRINQIQMKETAEEQKVTEQRVLLDRELVIQAAAVRVMKAKKQMKHSELINEVVEAIKGRFAIDSSEIKKQFEVLIEKDYMERVEGQRGVYQYVA